MKFWEFAEFLQLFFQHNCWKANVLQLFFVSTFYKELTVFSFNWKSDIWGYTQVISFGWLVCAHLS